MKSKTQKQDELKQGEELLTKSGHVLLVDFSQISTKDLGGLRRELKAGGNPLLVIKKRLLGLLLKKHEIEYKNEEFKAQVGAVFTSNIESATASVYQFFSALKKEKKIKGEHVLGGFNLATKTQMPATDVIAIGMLPPRDVLLAQLASMIAAPVRSFLYILQQKSEQMGAAAPQEEPKSTAPAAQEAAPLLEQKTEPESPPSKTPGKSDPDPETKPAVAEGEAGTAEEKKETA